MKRNGKRLVSILLIVIMSINLIAVNAFASDTKTGKYGSNIKWTYNTKTKVLTLNGKGKITYIDRDKIDCDGVKTITVGEGITRVDGEAFEDFSSSLRTINLPASLNQIVPFVDKSDGQFYEDPMFDYQAVNVAKENKVYSSQDGVLFNKAKTTLIKMPATKKGNYTVPSSVKKIRRNAFYESHLSSVAIPSNVTKIDDQSFINSYIKSISINAKSMVIGAEAFIGSGLQKITFTGNAPTFGRDAFAYVKASVFYPINKTWTVAKRKSYGGFLQWIGKDTSSKKRNSISASNQTKTSSTKNMSFSLNAKAKENAKLSYASDNQSVTVNSKGKVTIKKNFTGQAGITITAASTKNYAKTSKVVWIKVRPRAVKITSISSSNRKISFKIANVPCTGYEVLFSERKDFEDYAHIGGEATELQKYSKNGYVISGFWETKLKKGKTYYIRIRAVESPSNSFVDGLDWIYGPWTTKSIKVK